MTVGPGVALRARSTMLGLKRTSMAMAFSPELCRRERERESASERERESARARIVRAHLLKVSALV